MKTALRCKFAAQSHSAALLKLTKEKRCTFLLVVCADWLVRHVLIRAALVVVIVNIVHKKR